MGIIKMCNIEDYWNSSLHCAPIADKMSRNRFQTIHRILHFVDNNRVTDDDKLDRVWKLRMARNSRHSAERVAGAR